MLVNRVSTGLSDTQVALQEHPRPPRALSIESQEDHVGDLMTGCTVVSPCRGSEGSEQAPPSQGRRAALQGTEHTGWRAAEVWLS